LGTTKRNKKEEREYIHIKNIRGNVKRLAQARGHIREWRHCRAGRKGVAILEGILTGAQLTCRGKPEPEQGDPV